jgi:hypothetical protein
LAEAVGVLGAFVGDAVGAAVGAAVDEVAAGRVVEGRAVVGFTVGAAVELRDGDAVAELVGFGFGLGW